MGLLSWNNCNPASGDGQKLHLLFSVALSLTHFQNSESTSSHVEGEYSVLPFFKQDFIFYLLFYIYYYFLTMYRCTYLHMGVCT